MRKIIKISVLSMIVTVLVSCKKDFLDVQSKTNYTLDNYYTSYEECRNATAPLYNIVWYEFSTRFYFMLGDGRGNNLFTPYSTEESFIRLTETGETPLLNGSFEALYTVITQADYVINNIDKALEHNVSEQQVNACKAEAKFMRGLAYWYLGSLWGNVPIVEDPVAVVNNFKLRPNRFEDVLQYAIRDMEYAATWLPDTDVPGRLTKSSANGALARLYITAACYARGNKFSSKWPATAQDYYDKARDAAKKVLDDPNYKLMDDYEELFRMQNNNNSESLFALQFVPGSSVYGTGNRAQEYLASSTKLTGGLNAYGGSTFASGELVQLMHNRGETKRKKATFFYPGATYEYLGGDTPEGKWVVQPADYRYPNIKKHIVGGPADTDGFAINGNSGLATPMLRLAEVYLLYVEAIMGMDESTTDADALNYFNLVRKRAGFDEPVTSITRDQLWDERRCELALEGQYWYDMVRRAYWDEAWVINYMNNQRRSEYYYYLSNSAPNGFAWRNINDEKESNIATPGRLLLPYPATELIINPELKGEPVPFEFANQ